MSREDCNGDHTGSEEDIKDDGNERQNSDSAQAACQDSSEDQVQNGCP